MKIVEKFLERFRKYKSEHGFSCDVCSRELFDYPQHRLCESCEKSLDCNDGKTCPVCGRKAVADGVCLTCKAHRPVFDKGFSPLVYEGKSASLINRLKNGERYLAYFLAERMAGNFIRKTGGAFDKENAVVAAVPATEASKKKRGYNQAQELSKVFAEKTGVEYFPDMLVKTRETPLQKKLTARERMENVSGAFRVRLRTKCKDKTVLLIDDIMTTGSTGSECARILKNAGAKAVLFIAAASVKEIK